MTAFTLNELIQLSGISTQADYRTYDTAVPLDQRSGKFPHNGNAISVYRKNRLFPEVISYRELAQMALGRRDEYIQRSQREWLHQLVECYEEDQL